jgi:hypothetical protein
MNRPTVLLFFLAFLSSGTIVAQKAVPVDSKSWIPYNCEATFSGDSIHLVNKSGKTALLWAKGIHLENGIIELDIKGKDVRGESFVGVTFHAIDSEAYDAIYFRPFNFRNQERKNFSVQYIDKPANDWDMLREKHPGKYEHAIVPDTDPNNWFHVRIVIQFPSIKVYVNGSNDPTLQVEPLGNRTNGKFGLWVDSEEGWYKNIRLTNIKLK